MTSSNGSAAKWVAVQLTPHGEKEKNLSLLEKAARRILGPTIELFFPAVSQKVRNESHTMVYMDGYIFIRYDEKISYMKLCETQYFKTVLNSPGPKGKRVYHLIDDKVLDPMRSGLKNMKVSCFSVDEEVRVIQGSYKNLTGKICFIHDDGENVQIVLDLRSKSMLIDFPSSHLTKVA